MKDLFYITTPIYYVNGLPHIGHAYTTVAADVINRYFKLYGYETYFLTGTDEHGQNIADSAQSRNMEPKTFVDEMSANFKNLWPQLNIKNDQFIRTTDEAHVTVVKAVLQSIYDNGEIYKKEYEGNYCVNCERFLDDSELVEGLCPDHKKAPLHRKEENYFFKMSAYQDFLLKTIDDNPDWISPKRYLNEVKSFLGSPLKDLCISRPKSRLNWGIELPFDSNFVTYVWFDALLNYASALGGKDAINYSKFWPKTHHLIGKDILKTHAVYWPCMLKAAGMDNFKKLLVHGHWVIEGTKMSKSLGNVVDPIDMKDKVGVDSLRYFLIRDMSFGEDANFSEKLVLTRYNGDLANNIGNLISRSVSMSRRNFEGQVPACSTITDIERDLFALFEESIRKTKELLLNFQPHRLLDEITLMSSAVNKYIDSNKPWALAKDESQLERLGTILYTALDCTRMIVCLLEPVMPEKMAIAKQMLGVDEPSQSTDVFKFSLLKEGSILPEPEPLFPKIKYISADEESDEELPKQKQSKKADKNQAKEQVKENVSGDDNLIGIDEFAKIEIRVGQIVGCKKVEKSDKLLHSQVDLGEGRLRSIVSGIAQFYDPSEMPTKRVLVVANLKPIKLRGVLSEGMVLCSDDGKNLSLVDAPQDCELGTLVK